MNPSTGSTGLSLAGSGLSFRRVAGKLLEFDIMARKNKAVSGLAKKRGTMG
jgi:hypothetical protein